MTRAVRTLATLLLTLGVLAQAQDNGGPLYGEPWRPQFHFSPPLNWMNDPNGLIYYEGEYHLFYQTNPVDNRWGNIGWGHAVSRDLVRWRHLLVAIPEEDGVMAWSGSAVIDWANTSGFGENGQPPMVAIYTGYEEATGNQTQNLAYSTDRGRTWTKYEGNPVLDAPQDDFRDPKVFWFEPTRRWVMAVMLPHERQVSFYGSPDLKSWTHLSDFGPAGATGGIWEVPDLFRLPVAGRPGETRWVLQVNIGGGTLYGGSGAQYFVGTFDGERFTAEGDPARFPVPGGEVVADFEGDGYGGWEATGTAFGAGPARGAMPEQDLVGNFLGRGLANSFAGGDAARGTLTSPPFKITRDYLNLLVGGGADPGETAVNLLVGGEVVRSAAGEEGEWLDWRSWDVRAFRGERARVEIIDRGTGDWGHIGVDHIGQSDRPARPLKARARWVDYGKDFYAAVSWANLERPDGKGVWLGWLSNWQYASSVPTYPWRSAQSVPRTLHLEPRGGELRLVQQPVGALRALRGEGVAVRDQRLQPGETFRPDIEGDLLEVAATFELGDAAEVGFAVRVGQGERTRIGYDARAAELFVDRRRSGRSDFSDDFAGVHRGPLSAPGGRVTIHALVDTSSVEVFGGGGRTVITDLIFPDRASRGVEVYAAGGAARLVSLQVWPLRSIWTIGGGPTP